jgi:hypothetical protein
MARIINVVGFALIIAAMSITYAVSSGSAESTRWITSIGIGAAGIGILIASLRLARGRAR